MPEVWGTDPVYADEIRKEYAGKPTVRKLPENGCKDRIVLANGEVTSGTIVADPIEADGYGYVSHFATCEYAQRFRRK